MALVLQPTLLELNKTKQVQDPSFDKIWGVLKEGHAGDFHVDNFDVLQFQSLLCVPADLEIKEEILKEAHRTP